MDAPRGRPTRDPKIGQYKVRLSEDEMAMLNYAHEILGITKSEVIRLGIEEMYKKAVTKK